MRRIGGSAVSVLAFMLLSGCAGDEGLPLPKRADGGSAAAEEKIAFSSDRDGDSEIYVMNPDGSDVRQLTHNEETGGTNASDDSPVWSPDGRKIAFASTRDHPSGDIFTEEIYVMDADGSNERRLTADRWADVSPWWTKDGDIAFTTCKKTILECEMTVIAPDASNRRTLDVAAELVYGFAPSPDASKIAFTVTEGGIKGAAEGRNADVYVMDADGGNRRRLTESKAPDRGATWSPDGERLAFTSERDRNGRCLWHDCVGYNPEIYVMRADGSNETRLTNDPGDDGTPEWSPDGERLLFSAYRDGNDYELYVMNADGTCVIQLTRNREFDVGVDWYWPPEANGAGRLEC